MILLTAMEYLRDEVVEKEEETARERIETISIGRNPDVTTTSAQDVEVTQTVQEKKVRWVDWIKTIGEYRKFHLCNLLELTFQKERCCLA